MPAEVMGELFAFVSIDPDSQAEVIVGMREDGNWQPLVVADREHTEQLKPVARRIAHDTGRAVKLIRFTEREELPL